MPKNNYTSESIQVLKDLEAVRLRPGMYIGDTSEPKKGLSHLVFEILDNSIDEAMAGVANKITVTLFKDGSAEIQDNGRGIPVDIHKSEKISAATVALTVLHAGGKFGGENSAYKQAGGLHGVGSSVVNFLSKDLHLTIKREEYTWTQEFKTGKPVAALKRGKPSKEHGTTIRFWPDETIFSSVVFPVQTIRERVCNAAFLNPGLEIELIIEGLKPEIYKSESFGEIIDFLEDGKFGTAISDRIDAHKTIDSDKGSVEVFASLRWYNSDEHLFAGFANGVSTPWGGTHETGFRTALLKSITTYGTNNNLLKEPLIAEDVREGLVAAVAVRLGNPSFEGQTKEKLLNNEANGACNSAVYQSLSTFFEEHPTQAKEIIGRALRASKARLAARAAREKISRKDVFSIGTLPGKLTDCSSKKMEETEVILVEGDSAGGTATECRDPRIQAILPLRGKILNTQKAEDHRALKSEQIDVIIRALGCGVGKHFDKTKLRYNKVIIMTDADVDGAHIATLLLTFFNQHIPDLIKEGHVYVAMPPLYRVRKGKQSSYIRTEEDLQQFFQTNSRDGWIIQRFKGLGEMDQEELGETTMDPATRTLGQVRYQDDLKENTEPTFEMLMGSDVVPRRAFIEKNAKFATIDI